MDATTQSQIRDAFGIIKKQSYQLRFSSVKERKTKLKRLEKWILANRSEIQEALYQDLQKPPKKQI